MSRFIIFLFLIICVSSSNLQSDFLENQKKYERVRTALSEKENLLVNELKSKSISLNQLNVLFIAYKSENELNLFVKKKSDNKYTLFKTYSICAQSGVLGPKRKQGDYQVPEGIYHIDRFNPSSSFYLSLGINYPNTSDRIKSTASNLGGDIFIHGNCVSIGCLSMTDDYIKEIYLLAIHAKNNAQNKIPVYIFPYKMTERNHNKYKATYSNNPALLQFWNRLKVGYDKFETNKSTLIFKVDEKGNYIF
jgi:murein L,D-transpeptidase YafK